MVISSLDQEQEKPNSLTSVAPAAIHAHSHITVQHWRRPGSKPRSTGVRFLAPAETYDATSSCTMIPLHIHMFRLDANRAKQACCPPGGLAGRTAGTAAPSSQRGWRR